MKKTIFYWAPCLDRVGTEKSVRNSAVSFAKYSNEFEVSVVNVFGEWNRFKEFFKIHNIRLINLGPNIYNFLPKKGFIASRLSYLIIILINFVPLLRFLIKNKPDYLVVHLITSLPIFLFNLLKIKTKLILRISGNPKLTLFRKFLWKQSSKNIDLVTCPTKELKKNLEKENIFQNKKIFFLQDAIINLDEFVKKKNDTNFITEYDVKKKYFLAVGRLTKQKNFEYLINEFIMFKNDFDDKNIKLLIIGDGEEKNKLIKLIKKKNFSEEIEIINRTENVYKYMLNAEAFILSSLWEEMGFVIVEASLCNCFIISSNCPNGPSEFLDQGKSGYLYENNVSKKLSEVLKKFSNTDKKKIDEKKIKTKKNCKIFTNFQHFKTFENIINEN